MSFYPEKISRRFNSPKNAGRLSEASAIGTEANFTCGVSIRFYLEIDERTKEIVNAKFTTNGCGYVIAFADLLAENIQEKKLTDLHGLEDLENAASEEFGDIDASRILCANLCFDALHNALAEYRRSQLAEWSGEKALICTCFGVEEETIEEAIRDQNLKTVEMIGDKLNAGTGCGSCQPLIQEILDSQNWD